ncbi:hypothetical protein OH76DRAFT_16905 [Lentinus brumalis]|uniref:Uncharacterized protein n=1 Tax=Lentinus brumalis TaxID=2498619 RepID=A0A371DX54_9APHY|nr:hypothetical protein OH76DRAFT_16905 [Polyporus brumalis]
MREAGRDRGKNEHERRATRTRACYTRDTRLDKPQDVRWFDANFPAAGRSVGRGGNEAGDGSDRIGPAPPSEHDPQRSSEPRSRARACTDGQGRTEEDRRTCEPSGSGCRDATADRQRIKPPARTRFGDSTIGYSARAVGEL